MFVKFMSEIYEPTDDFDFESVSLLPPINQSGGNYFIRYRICDSPLYIQTPECIAKQSITKSGKKAYCEIMFSRENEKFIRWIENLENYCKKIIFENRQKWFLTDLEENDIDNSFTSSLKIYKSGKFYVLKTHIPINNEKICVKIYDENENELDIENIQENTKMISILEFQGIKCSSKNFQIEIEMKQILVLEKKNPFEECIFKKKEIKNSTIRSSNETNTLTISEEPKKTEIPKKSVQNVFAEEIQEVDLNLEKMDDLETFQLKPRSDVYYTMYYETIKRAKIARDLAISSYLEAKKIKNAYLLEHVEDDSDLEGDDFFKNLSV